MSFVHLHVHTHYSLLDGLGKIDDMIEKAKSYGMSALAITDHGTMYGVVEFYKKCKEAGIKPIIGVETYVAPRTLNDKVAKIDASPYHLILLAKNNEGYKNLLKLISIAHLKGYYYKPRIDKNVLKKYSKGLIGMSACLQGEVPRNIENGNYKEALKATKEYQKIFGSGSFYLEVQSHVDDETQKKVNEGLIKVSKESGVGLVATSDIHYVNKDDQEAHEILLCVQTQKTINDDNRMSLAEFDLSMKSPDEMAEAFKHIPEALENTEKIADMCDIEIKMGEYVFPKFEIPGGKDPDVYLSQVCNENLAEKYGKNVDKETKNRLEYELSIIKTTGFASYILMVADYAGYATKKGIFINTRGSAAGSVVCYLTGITDIDPMKYGLLFERFLNPERISMPDVDLDIADRHRDEVIKYVSQKYGKQNVAQIITFGTMAARAAIRDCARAMGLQYSFADRLAKMIPPGMKLPQALEEVSELKADYKSDPQTKKLLDLSLKLEGVARHASVHAAGIVIGDKNLDNYTPLQFSTKDPDSVITQYEMHALEDIGLVKMDFLGLANLTIIEQAIKIISKTKDVTIVSGKIPLNDKKTYSLLQKAETSGVFQLESDGMKRYLKELKPDRIEDIIAMVALYRPGPMDFIPDYIDGKHGRKQIEYLHPKLKPILEETYGVAVYQEQVLQMARDLCGFSLGEADILRKAIGKKIKELLMEQKEKWVEGAAKQGIKKELAEKLFKFVEPFARYGFNKAHSASYAMIAYITAYLKANYPSEFMAAWLTSERERNIEKVAYALTECERMKLKVWPPDVNNSYVDFGVDKESGDIIYSLAAIKNVGQGIAEKIVEERKQGGEYKDLEDFVSRLGPEVINKKVIEALAKTGAIDKFGTRGQMIAGVEEICKFAHKKDAENNSNQIGLFNIAGENKLMDEKISLPEVDEVDKKTKLLWEKELLGIYLTDHPLGDYKKQIAQYATSSLAVSRKMENQKTTIGGIITKVHKITTKNGQPMVFANIDDGDGIIEAVVFPTIYEKTSAMWREDNIVMVSGKLNYKDDAPKVLVDKMVEIGEQAVLDEFAAKAEETKKTVIASGDEAISSDASRQSEAPSNKSRDSSASPQNDKNIPSLHIKIPKGISKKDLLEIKTTLSTYPGSTDVILSLPQNGTHREVKLSNRVNICPALLDQLKELVSEKNILTS